MEAGLQNVGDAGEDIGAPRLEIDVVHLCGGDHVVHDRHRRLSAVLTAGGIRFVGRGQKHKQGQDRCL